MSEIIKPKEGIVYECCKSFTDKFGDRARIGQKFYLDEDGRSFTMDDHYHVMRKTSGRGCDIAISVKDFATYFSPINEQTNTTNEQTATTKFKVGDKVRIAKSSEWYDENEESYSCNPPNVDGEIYRIDNYDNNNLDIYVEWDNGADNSYNEYDLVLVEQESYDNNQSNQNNMKKVLIVVDNEEQIKKLAKVPFLKEQIESKFPELFITHKIGNRYKDKNGNRYILTGEIFCGSNCATLINLKTGLVESLTVKVNDFNKITPNEFSVFCIDNLELIKEHQ